MVPICGTQLVLPVARMLPATGGQVLQVAVGAPAVAAAQGPICGTKLVRGVAYQVLPMARVLPAGALVVPATGAPTICGRNNNGTETDYAEHETS